MHLCSVCSSNFVSSMCVHMYKGDVNEKQVMILSLSLSRCVIKKFFLYIIVFQFSMSTYYF